MPAEIGVEPVQDHEYRVRVVDAGEDTDFEVVVHPDVLADLGFTSADEELVVRHTAAFLADRQPVVDLPSLVYLDEVAAAYGDYPEQLRRRCRDDRPSPGRPF